jgi:hypothetical protein
MSIAAIFLMAQSAMRRLPGARQYELKGAAFASRVVVEALDPNDSNHRRMVYLTRDGSMLHRGHL